MHAAESPNLSVVVSTDDAPYVSELEDVVGAGAEIVVVSTRRVERAGPTVHVLPLESAYRRNRGLALAQGRIVAFLEDGQLPAEDWRAAVEASFASRSRPAAVLSVAQSSLRRGGNVAYDRARLLAVRGFPLFTGAQPGSAVPDLLALRQLAVAGGGVLSVRGMTLRNTGCVRPPDDERLVGRAFRVTRQRRVAARRAAGALSKLEVRETFALARGMLFDRRWPYEPPDLRAEIPSAVAAAIEGRRLAHAHAQQKAKLHVLYRAGDVMVHLYIAPTDHLRQAIAARSVIEAGSPAGGVPRTHASAEGTDALWLVEDTLPGTPVNAERLSADAERIAAWIVSLGGPAGPPLEEAPSWRRHRNDLLTAPFSGESARRLELSLEAVRTIPSRYLHGDLNPRNVLVAGDRLGAVDWENAAERFLPGLDLVFLFLLAGDTPNRTILLDPPPFLVSGLRTLGIEDELRPHAVRVMLATWALGERKRRARLGVDPGPAVFEPFFENVEAALR